MFLLYISILYYNQVINNCYRKVIIINLSMLLIIKLTNFDKMVTKILEIYTIIISIIIYIIHLKIKEK